MYACMLIRSYAAGITGVILIHIFGLLIQDAPLCTFQNGRWLNEQQIKTATSHPNQPIDFTVHELKTKLAWTAQRSGLAELNLE